MKRKQYYRIFANNQLEKDLLTYNKESGAHIFSKNM